MKLYQAFAMLVLIPGFSMTNSGKVKIPEPRDEDCLRPDGRRTVYKADIAPNKHINVFTRRGDAAEVHAIRIYINDVLIKETNNHTVESMEWQNTTIAKQELKITSEMRYVESPVSKTLTELKYEDKLCKMKRSRGRESGGEYYCECTGTEPDYNDGFIYIQTF